MSVLLSIGYQNVIVLSVKNISWTLVNDNIDNLNNFFSHLIPKTINVVPVVQVVVKYNPNSLLFYGRQPSPLF